MDFFCFKNSVNITGNLSYLTDIMKHEIKQKKLTEHEKRDQKNWAIACFVSNYSSNFFRIKKKDCMAGKYYDVVKIV